MTSDAALMMRVAQLDACKWFSGTDTLGAPCQRVLDLGLGDSCEEGLICDWDTDRCVAAGVDLPLGASCDGDYSTCAGGLVCGWTSGVCETPPALGEPCDADCAPGAYCDLTGASVCVPRVGLGEPCLDHDMCEEQLECDFDTETCVASGAFVCQY